jgi:cytochrome c oxidase assembly factor CtaG
MIRKISDISRQHPFASLFGLTFILNAYIQGMSWTINSIDDPMSRQFKQNIFICLLCAVVAIAAVAFVFICRMPSPTFDPAELTKRERTLRRLLFDFIVPLVMGVVVVGDLLILLSLKW